MSDALLSALQRRFAAAADALPAALPAIESDDPTAFLLRYRRDALAGLSEQQFRRMRHAVREERDLDRRRAATRRALERAGRLTDALIARIEATRDLAWLEDLQRPLRKPEGAAEDPMTAVARKVHAGEAPETLEELLRPFCGPDGAHPTAADQRERLVGLVAGIVGEDADARAAVRDEVRRHGVVATQVDPKHASAPTWKPFSDLRKPIGEVDGRLLLLLRRGQKLGAVKLRTEIPDEVRAALLAGPLAPPEGRPHADVLAEAAKQALDRVLLPAAASSVLVERRRAATRSLLPRLQRTLQERLMAPPAGAVPVVAVAPGTPGSCRLLVVDEHGRHGATAAVHPFPPQNEKEAAAKALAEMLTTSGAKLVVAAGSRKARATQAFVEEVLAQHRDLGASLVLVNEQAPAAWSESDEAKAETPELAASGRAALAMARFVQDPLRESARWDLTLLPLDPSQRDLDQGELRAALDEVVEECVAEVGVDVNTASVALLSRVPGLGAAAAKAIVAARERSGTFPTRAKVREVEGITEEQWQRAGGFLRVRDGVDPLDATAVHPTGLDVVQAVAAAKGVEPSALVGNAALLEGVDAAQFAGPVFTASDVESVLHALRAGPADPRTQFVAPAFNPGVRRLRDLDVGMEVEGVVASVSKFGAFVDLGVRQHGLVHVSELSHDFVQDPAQVVQVGQKVRVKVLGIDPAKRRISLSMKALLPAPERPPAEERPRREREFAGAGGGAGGGFGGPPRGGFQGGERGGARPPRRGEGGPGRGPRGGRDDRRDGPPGPGGFRPERPGTPPRRAQRSRRFGGGDDRRSADALGLSRDREDRRRKPAEAAVEETAPAPRVKPPVQAVDPFLAQLQALSSQLGIPVRQQPAPRPAAPQPPAADGPRNRKERRAQILAQREAERAAAAAAGTSSAESAAPPSDAPAETASAEPQADVTPVTEPAPEPAAPAPEPAPEPTEPAEGTDRPT